MAKDAQEKPNFKSGILNFFAFFVKITLTAKFGQ